MSHSSREKATIVSVAGGYWTGSSAIFDLLNEHQLCCSVPEEFALLSYGQLLEELNQLGPKKANDLTCSIYRFKAFNQTNKFYPIRPFLRRLCAALNLYPPALTAIRAGMGERLGPIYSKACQEFIAAVDCKPGRRSDPVKITPIIRSLLDSISVAVAGVYPPVRRYVVLDQFISPAYAEIAIQYDPRIKLIFVDRDWRDQYTEVRDILHNMNKANSRLGVRPSGEALSDYKLTAIDFFISLRRRIDLLRNAHRRKYSKNILWVNFEESVSKTNDLATEIFSFLDLKNNGWQPNTIFNPSASKKNVGKWKSFQYPAEIKSLMQVLPIPS